jgi:hypothetical protein
MRAFSINRGAKAVLKPPHSTRWRDCQAASEFAKRLECGAFTAALCSNIRHARIVRG